MLILKLIKHTGAVFFDFPNFFVVLPTFLCYNKNRFCKFSNYFLQSEVVYVICTGAAKGLEKEERK